MRNSSQVESNRFSKSLWRLAAGLLIVQGVVWGSPVLAKNDPNKLTYGELFKEVDGNLVSKVEIDPATKVAKVTFKNTPANKARVKEVELLDHNSELGNKLNINSFEYSFQKSDDEQAIVAICGNLFSKSQNGLPLLGPRFPRVYY